MKKDIMTIKELSSYLNISISGIRKLVRYRNIPFFRIGNRIYFDLNKINNWIEIKEKQEEKTILF